MLARQTSLFPAIFDLTFVVHVHHRHAYVIKIHKRGMATLRVVFALALVSAACATYSPTLIAATGAMPLRTHGGTTLYSLTVPDAVYTRPVCVLLSRVFACFCVFATHANNQLPH